MGMTSLLNDVYTNGAAVVLVVLVVDDVVVLLGAVVGADVGGVVVDGAVLAGVACSGSVVVDSAAGAVASVVDRPHDWSTRSAAVPSSTARVTRRVMDPVSPSTDSAAHRRPDA